MLSLVNLSRKSREPTELWLRPEQSGGGSKSALTMSNSLRQLVLKEQVRGAQTRHSCLSACRGPRETSIPTNGRRASRSCRLILVAFSRLSLHWSLFVAVAHGKFSGVVVNASSAWSETSGEPSQVKSLLSFPLCDTRHTTHVTLKEWAYRRI
jgi:hypothetical protein